MGLEDLKYLREAAKNAKWPAAGPLLGPGHAGRADHQARGQGPGLLDRQGPGELTSGLSKPSSSGDSFVLSCGCRLVRTRRSQIPL